jgi:2-keto-4-pentenoate hydratase/2-oxohepta-3-ene-1,7-dioic acid hydratase in catechol pathway
MKLVTYHSAGNTGYGILTGENIATLYGPYFPPTLLDFIHAGTPALKQAAQALQDHRLPLRSISSVKILTPIANPGKIVAIGLNYWDHCREQNLEAPKTPIIFTKFTTAIIGPGDTITYDPALTTQVDYEVELGVVIGKQARNVSLDTALDYVFGYTIVNDVSARDLQFSDKQWVRAKSLDTFCPIGPCITTADEIPDPQVLHLKTIVNGRVLQDSSTREMIFGVADLIHRLSHSFTLMPGDVIATGTPDGVGVFRKPQVFLLNGDHVTVEVENIGQLENSIATVSAEQA